MIRITTAAIAALLALPAAAQDVSVGAITVGHPTVFAPPGMARSAAGYMTITNDGDAPARLLAAESPAARTEMHRTETDDAGVARMIRQDAVEIPPGGSVAFEPGGLHVMFMGLDGIDLTEGAGIDATLTFEGEDPLRVTFAVEARDGAAGGMDHGAAHGSGDDAAD